VKIRAAGVLAVACLSFAGSARAAEKVSLADAVRMALAKNPTAVTADAEIRRAEALAVEARSGWYPTLFGSGVYTRLDADRTLAGAAGAPPRVISAADSISANLTLSVPFVHPKAWATWSHASDGIDVATATKVDIRRQIAVATARAYLAVIAQKRVIEATERARDTAHAHWEFSHKRLAGGVGNRIDDVRAEQELATDEAQLASTKGGLIRAEEALGVLVGAEGPIDIADEAALGEPPQLAAALDEARTRRADVKASEVRVIATEHAVRDSWTDYSPYLVGVFQPLYQNPPSLTQPLTGWQAQLLLTLPLYDGGLRYGQKKERDALRDEAKLALEATLRQARSDVRTAFGTLQRADESLQAARQAAVLARQALELATLAYQAGATTNLEVIDAERRARDAETQGVVAEDAARQARLDLLAASGRFP
jgi:outer membrane protein